MSLKKKRNNNRNAKDRNKWWCKQEMVCYKCRIKIDRNLDPDHPQRATIDHVKPVSLGGIRSKQNWAPCCYECNQKHRPMPTFQCSRKYLYQAILDEDHAEVYLMLKTHKNHLNLSLIDIAKIIEKS